MQESWWCIYFGAALPAVLLDEMNGGTTLLKLAEEILMPEERTLPESVISPFF